MERVKAMRKLFRSICAAILGAEVLLTGVFSFNIPVFAAEGPVMRLASAGAGIEKGNHVYYGTYDSEKY